MNVKEPSGSNTDLAAARIAAAIGEPARARILFCLMDGHARTSTELAVVAGVSPSTASVHLNRLKQEGLIKVLACGKHRFHSLENSDVASALEGLRVLAGGSGKRFVPAAPVELRKARTCYDHIAGRFGVLLHDRFLALRWITIAPSADCSYELTRGGEKAFSELGIDVNATRKLRRHFASACLDWSERRPHIGGALGAAILHTALKRKWVEQELDSRVLKVTRHGKREMESRLGLQL